MFLAFSPKGHCVDTERNVIRNTEGTLQPSNERERVLHELVIPTHTNTPDLGVCRDPGLLVPGCQPHFI